MEHLDLKLLSRISLILGFVYHMIAFLNLQKKILMHRQKITISSLFLPKLLRKSIFTAAAKDNFNATSSTVVKHFYGTSMTVMQFPSAENLRNDNSLLERTQLIDEQVK